MVQDVSGRVHAPDQKVVIKLTRPHNVPHLAHSVICLETSRLILLLDPTYLSLSLSFRRQRPLSCAPSTARSVGRGHSCRLFPDPKE